jgi:hypothetical protein
MLRDIMLMHGDGRIEQIIDDGDVYRVSLHAA